MDSHSSDGRSIGCGELHPDQIRLAHIRGVRHVQPEYSHCMVDSENVMTWDDIAKVLIFDSGRMVGGDQDKEVVDVIVEAADLDLSFSEQNELQDYTVRVMHQFHQQMRKLADTLPGASSDLKVT
jgi:hypothetical protein